MLLYKAALGQKENLEVFRGMEVRSSFLDSVNNFISEMKQYNATAEDLKNLAESMAKDSYTQKKLLDVFLQTMRSKSKANTRTRKTI